MKQKKQKQNKRDYGKLTFISCGYCSRDIIKEDEKNNEIFMKDGKPMCMICRATKLSEFNKEIKGSKRAMKRDLKKVNKNFDKEETKRVVHVSAEAQAVVEKKLNK